MRSSKLAALVLCTIYFTEFSGDALAQINPPVVEWERTFGGDGRDRGYSVQQTRDGGYILVGANRSIDPGVWLTYVVRTDELGGQIWEMTFAPGVYGTVVRETANGQIVVLGDSFLGKLDPDGAVLWENRTGEIGGNDIEETADGGFIVAGSGWGPIGHGIDAVLTKTDADGEVLWNRTYGGEDDDLDSASKVQQTTDGGYIVVGGTRSASLGVVDGDIENVYVFKTDRNGLLLWQWGLGGTTVAEWGWTVQETTDGGYLLGGRGHLYKIDSAGILLWKTSLGRSINFVQEMRDGGYLVGAPAGRLGGLIRTDSERNVLWKLTLGGSLEELQSTADDGYVAVGNRGGDIYLAKLTAEGSDMAPPPPPAEPVGGPPIEWEKTYEAGGFSSVDQTVDGGFVLSGGGALVKTDQDGNVVWETIVEPGNTVQQTSDGGYILAGTERGEVEILHLLKTDADGNLLWDETFRGVIAGAGHSVQQTSDGGYVLAGTRYIGSVFALVWDSYLIKTDSNGNPEWQKALGPEGRDWAGSVRETSDGGYIVVGGQDILGLPERKSRDIVLFKADGDGNLLWTRVLGGDDRDDAECVRETSDGGFIVTGATWSFGGNGASDVYLLKTDQNGEVVWETTFGGDFYDRGKSVQQTTDGGYIVAGRSGPAMWIIKTDSEGNLVWRKTLGGEVGAAGNSVQQTFDGGYIVAGRNGDGPGYLVKLGPDPAPFRRGDANADGDLNLTDAVFTLGALFLGEARLTCADAADADDSGWVDLTDPVFLLNHLFTGGLAPSEPFPACGVDPNEDALGCASFPACTND